MLCSKNNFLSSVTVSCIKLDLSWFFAQLLSLQLSRGFLLLYACDGKIALDNHRAGKFYQNSGDGIPFGVN